MSRFAYPQLDAVLIGDDDEAKISHFDVGRAAPVDSPAALQAVVVVRSAGPQAAAKVAPEVTKYDRLKADVCAFGVMVLQLATGLCATQVCATQVCATQVCATQVCASQV